MTKQYDLYINNLTWLVILRLISETSTGTLIVKKRHSMKRRNDSGLVQANKFNGQFTDVFNKSEHNQVPLPNRSAFFMEENCPRVLKELASELSQMYAHLL